jgi:hypothetical protein
VTKRFLFCRLATLLSEGKIENLSYFCRNFKIERILAKKENPQSLAALRIFGGGDYWTRTSDLLRVNANVKLFLLLYSCFRLFLLFFTSSLDIFEYGISACSMRLCGVLCGQTRWNTAGLCRGCGIKRT